jgi:hypothetical protein
VSVRYHRRGWEARWRDAYGRQRARRFPSEDAARAFAEIGAEHVGLGDFSPAEFPLDPLDPDQLGQGANFRLNTNLGPLDIMQWIPGIEGDPAYPALLREAITATFRGKQLLVCGLDHLRSMKLAAGREQDLLDLRELLHRTG